MCSYAQKWEYIGSLNIGSFRFVGEGANNDANSYNAYGTKSGFSYEIGIDLKRVNRHRIRYGLNIGFESLQSKAPFTYKDLNSVNWEGRALLRHNFVMLNPYLSYTWEIVSVKMNLKWGLEPALRIGPAKENYKAVSESGEVNSYKQDMSSTAFDLRSSIQLNAFKNYFGLGLGYSHGIWDYKTGWKGGTTLIFSRYLKVSFLYQRNKKPKQ